jgi:hypothetical protein
MISFVYFVKGTEGKIERLPFIDLRWPPMALESGAEESGGSSDRVIILVHTNTISSSSLFQERVPTGCSFFKSNQQQFRRFNRTLARRSFAPA